MKCSVVDFNPGLRLKSALRGTASRPEGKSFIEMLRAVDAGRITLTVIIYRRANRTPRSLKSRLPTIVMIGDDHGDSRNPDEWRCSMSAIPLSRFAFVHGTGARPERRAAQAAELIGRCLFIETNSAHAPAWAAAITPREIHCQAIIPPRGGIDPSEAGLAGPK